MLCRVILKLANACKEVTGLGSVSATLSSLVPACERNTIKGTVDAGRTRNGEFLLTGSREFTLMKLKQ